MTEIEQLLQVMSQLRDPMTGCPWDVKQTFESLAPYTIEEAYEVVDAIASGDRDAIKDELGDLLLQVVFQAQMAAEENAFNFQDVAAAIRSKLVRRHPHVFADQHHRDQTEHDVAWEAIKRAERGIISPESVLDGVGGELPPLLRATKLQRRAATVGFDWDQPNAVIDKIQEELAEISECLELPTDHKDRKVRLQEEIGDLLFACTNLARHLDVDAELALSVGNRKFERRFRWIEKTLAERGQKPEELSLQALEALWAEAKLDLSTR